MTIDVSARRTQRRLALLSAAAAVIAAALQGGRRIDATLRPESRAGSRWVWLRWYTGDHGSGRIRSLLLTHEDIPAADLRRLIVRLRLDSFAGQERAADRRLPVSGGQQRVPEIPGA